VSSLRTGPATAAYCPPVPSQEFATHDLGVAAFLVALGHRMLRLDGHSGQRRAFVFEPAAGPIASEFYSGALVSARAYSLAIRDLKARLYSNL
jgi:hypothetical protein